MTHQTNTAEVEADLREQMRDYRSRPSYIPAKYHAALGGAEFLAGRVAIADDRTQHLKADVVTDTGRLTSAAVLQSYDAGAKSLEELSSELRDMLKRNDAMVDEANELLKQINETIAVCREQGKLFALRVTDSANMIKEVRDACTKLRELIEDPEKKVSQ